MKYTYKTKGTCASEINFEIEDSRIHNVSFKNGCNGNLKAISKLVEGEDARRVADILRGNTCGMKNTSCADQFSRAIEQALGDGKASGQ